VCSWIRIQKERERIEFELNSSESSLAGVVNVAHGLDNKGLVSFLVSPALLESISNSATSRSINQLVLLAAREWVKGK